MNVNTLLVAHGIIEPENEKPKMTLELEFVDTDKPALAAAPSKALLVTIFSSLN